MEYKVWMFWATVCAVVVEAGWRGSFIMSNNWVPISQPEIRVISSSTYDMFYDLRLGFGPGLLECLICPLDKEMK